MPACTVLKDVGSSVVEAGALADDVDLAILSVVRCRREDGCDELSEGAEDVELWRRGVSVWMTPLGDLILGGILRKSRKDIISDRLGRPRSAGLSSPRFAPSTSSPPRAGLRSNAEPQTMKLESASNGSMGRSVDTSGSPDAKPYNRERETTVHSQNVEGGRTDDKSTGIRGTRGTRSALIGSIP